MELKEALKIVHSHFKKNREWLQEEVDVLKQSYKNLSDELYSIQIEVNCKEQEMELCGEVESKIVAQLLEMEKDES